MSKQHKHDHEENAVLGASPRAEAGPDAASAQAQAQAQAQGDQCADLREAAQEAGDACRERVQHDTIALAEKDARIAELEGEVSGLKDQYLRKLADYENFRKRMFREKDEAVQYANSQLLTDLVSVLDNFDRAIKSSEISRDFQTLHDGVEMIRRGLLAMLEGKYGLSRYESLGKPFDPHVHEAMMSERGDCADPVVIEEYSTGYKLRDKVLRSAKVKVRMPSGEAWRDAASSGEPPKDAETFSDNR